MRDGDEQEPRVSLVKISNFFSTVHIADGNLTLCRLPLGPNSYTLETAREADKCMRCRSAAEAAQNR